MVEEKALSLRSFDTRSRKVLIGTLVIFLAVSYLVVTAAQGSSTYYLTVGELKAQGPSARVVRVAGDVRGESIVWNARELILTFEIGDESGVLPVSYHGPRPDMLLDGATAVLEGRYSGGTFEADTLLLKCSSKYEVAE
jgi:cytochrome c-type biogenesis protein CcmE